MKLIAGHWLEMEHVWNDWNVSMKRENEVNQDSRMAGNEDWHWQITTILIKQCEFPENYAS